MHSDVNFEPLTPTAFLLRSALVFADRVAVIDDDACFTYGEFLSRCEKFAGALVSLGVRPGGRVAVLAGNTHVMLAAHYAVPFAGAVLVPLNTRLSAQDIGFILRHSGCSLLIYDHDLRAIADKIGEGAGCEVKQIRAGGADDELEPVIGAASPHRVRVSDECGLLAINYTSGTTARPKGVMYHHRGAYLQSLAMAFHMRLDSDSGYLWTLPMFHCNGWCFTWAVTAAGGVHLCLRKVKADLIWRRLWEGGVTHFCAAPTVLGMIAWDSAGDEYGNEHRVRVGTGGAPPSPALLERLGGLGMDVTHLYGSTETYGPSAICEWRTEWNTLGASEQAQLRARQGVANIIGQQIRVVDDHGLDIPRDGATIGEVAMRGNNLMLGYYADDAGEPETLPRGWLRMGDLAVVHDDGYMELKDRAKDIIISGGENISSVEIEQALMTHPAVKEAAVVAGPDARWGEVPVAFVTLQDDAAAGEDELIGHTRGVLAKFKVPKRIIFTELPKTATGKIQKNLLRERLAEGPADR